MFFVGTVASSLLLVSWF